MVLLTVLAYFSPGVVFLKFVAILPMQNLGTFVPIKGVIDALNTCNAIAPLAPNQLSPSLDEHLLLLAFPELIHLLASFDDFLSALARLG